MRLFVAIPALNEEVTVGQVIRGIPRDIPGVSSTHVVVVNDGSTDRTAEVASEAGATVLYHPTPRGVGAAFHTALQHVIANRGDLLVTLDADGQFNPADIPELARPVIDGVADFSTASRFKDPKLVPEMPGTKLWGNRQMSRLVSRLTGGKYFDVSCGMRCYSRRAMLNLNLMGAFTYTQEVFLNLAFKRLRIAEIPIKVRGQREFGKSRVASNLFKYAINTSRIIFRAYRDYKPMRFFGKIALYLSIPALALEARFFWHYIETGRFYGYLWAGLTGAGLFGLALLSLHMGLMGDMMNRHRVYLEELLFLQRSEMSHDYPRESVPALPTVERAAEEDAASTEAAPAEKVA
jgi:glycosyltransferase involved in cell wall biosynthesis